MIIEITKSRMEELLFYAFDWASCCGPDTFRDLINATGVTEEELDCIGIDSSCEDDEYQWIVFDKPRTTNSANDNENVHDSNRTKD